MATNRVYKTLWSSPATSPDRFWKIEEDAEGNLYAAMASGVGRRRIDADNCRGADATALRAAWESEGVPIDLIDRVFSVAGLA